MFPVVHPKSTMPDAGVNKKNKNKKKIKKKKKQQCAIILTIEQEYHTQTIVWVGVISILLFLSQISQKVNRLKYFINK